MHACTCVRNVSRYLCTSRQLQSSPTVFCGALVQPRRGGPEGFGRHCLCNATCLIRPHLFYALFIVSRITIMNICVRQVVLDKWFPQRDAGNPQPAPLRSALRLLGVRSVFGTSFVPLFTMSSLFGFSKSQSGKKGPALGSFEPQKGTSRSGRVMILGFEPLTLKS